MSQQPQQRYLIKEILGKGGMGAVYRAYDNETRREVTLKTLLDVQDRAMLDLFYRECQVLATLNHPNIVDIYDVGEMELEGSKKPYFVMPLLAGHTLDQIIANASHRLTPDAVVDILAQAARGLHAAHERGLVHRDIKPSNIFVMEDDSVKIIDFGVAHLADGRTSTTLKGTLHYMAPEQLQMQKPTPVSDLFSLAVVAYQTFTRRRPFEGAGADETIQAILHRVPPPVSDLNPAVSRAVSQVIHKAMAKQPYHRFANLREFSDSLQKALRGEPLDLFDDSKILPRVERARKAVEAGEYEFASEVLAGLEAEGFLHPDMAGLRRNVDDAIRGRAISQRLATARRFLEEEEFQLAITKVQELLQMDPGNAEAMALKSDIEGRRSAEQVARWMKLADQHAGNHAYAHARQALENVIALRPHDTGARKYLSSILEREQEYLRLRREKEQLHRAAVEAWKRGDVSAALADMERVIELDKRAPESAAPEKGAAYQGFYNQVRSGHDALQSAYGETRRLMNERRFKEALAQCEAVLAEYPEHALFQALKVDVEQQARQDLSAFIARIDREVEQERDLDRRLSLLKQALAERPGEQHFARALQLTESKRDLVNGLVAKAQAAEQNAQYQDALSQWETLRSIYPIYPGLEFEIQRLQQRRTEQAQSDARRDWVRRVDQAVLAGQFGEAHEALRAGLVEFPGDPELEAFGKVVQQGRERMAKAEAALEQGRQLCEAGQPEPGLAALRQARQFDDANPRIRTTLLDTLVRQSRAHLDRRDRSAAEGFAREASALEPANPAVKSLLALIEDRKRAEVIDRCVAEAREHQSADQVADALTAIDRGLQSYPEEQRLLQLRLAIERTRTMHLAAPAPEPVTIVPAAPPALPKPPAALPLDDAATLVIPGVTDAFAARPPAPPPPPPPPPSPKLPTAAAPPMPPPVVPVHRNAAPPAQSNARLIYAGAGVGVAIAVAALVFFLTARSGSQSVAPPVPPQPSPQQAAQPVPPPPAETQPEPAAAQPELPPTATGPAKGTLILTVNEPGFTLTLDGRPLTGFRPSGRPNEYVIAGLNAGPRRLAAQKPGFRAEPESKIAAIAENQTARLELKLVPNGPGRWVLQGARPGTQVVLVGGRLLGTADAQGNAGGSDLPEGTHDIELRLKGHHRRSGIRLSIRNGQETLVSQPPLERIEVLLELQRV